KKGGNDGVCEPVAKETDPDDDCPEFPAEACATTGLCDGAGKCALQPTGAACGRAACEGSVGIQSVCDGKGACNQTSTSCAPYACVDAGACRTRCDSNEECVADGQCDLVHHVCLARVDYCDDAHTLYHPDGTTTDCSPFRCADGRCPNECRSADDCVSPL